MKNTILRLLSADCPSRDSLYWQAETGSTNNDLKALAAAGAPHGTVVLAGRQTAGRGRMGRSFLSPDGGIYMSLLLRPRCSANDLMHLTCAVATGACDAIERTCGFRPQVKWINDLVWKKKKLGGILTELSLNADGTVNYAIIGIGINVNTVPEQVADMATSLSEISDASYSAVAAALIEVLSTMDYTDRQNIMTRYSHDCITVGQQIRVLQGDQDYVGVAEKLTDDGSLVVRKADGAAVTVTSGEVSVRGMYGYL